MTRPTTRDIDALVRQVVSAAAAVAADRPVELEVRRNHAGLCYSLSNHVGPDERLCAEVMLAAQRSTDDRQIVRNLLEAAAVLAPDLRRLLRPVRRLCAAAFAAGHGEALLVGLTWVARVASGQSDGEVPHEWFAALRGVGVSRLPYLLREWVGRFGAGHLGLLALVREREACLLAAAMTTDALRAIHSAQPTVSGWLALARSEEPVDDRLRTSFGDCGAAAATLLAARDAATDDVTRERLSRWCAELAVVVSDTCPSADAARSER